MTAKISLPPIEIGLIILLLAGCASGGESNRSEVSSDAQTEPVVAESEPTPESEPNPEPAEELPPWVVVQEIKADLPSIITAFVNEDHGIASDTGGGIYLTWDGGNTWEQITDNAPEVTALEYVDENLIWYVGFGGIVMRSNDGGQNWVIAGALPFGGHNEFVSFVDDQAGWVSTTEMGSYWVTNDGAETWTEYSLPEGMNTVAAMHLRTEQDAYFLDLTGNLFVTSDSGASWASLPLGLRDGSSIPKLPHMAAIRFTDQNHGLVTMSLLVDGGSRTVALHTDDGGANWTEEELPVPMGTFHITRDGLYLTHIDVIDHSLFTVMRSTELNPGVSLRINRDLSVRMIQEEAYVFSHAFP